METREQREARWRIDHKWDGPLVSLGWGDVPTCSICGADASDQLPCLSSKTEDEIAESTAVGAA